MKKIPAEFGERKTQVTLPVLTQYVAQSGVAFERSMTNECGMKCILSCDKPCDSYIEKDDQCETFSLAKTTWSNNPSNYLLQRPSLDLKFMSLNKMYSGMKTLKNLGQEYLDGLDASKKQCDDDGIVVDVSAKPEVLTIKQLAANQGCTFMFSNLNDDDKLVTMTLKQGFKV